MIANKISVIISVLAILLLVSVVFAEQVCPTIIGWKKVNNSCISDSGCDYDLSGNTTYYGTKEMCLSALNCTPYFTCPNGTNVSWCTFENNKCVCIISPENQCAGYCTEGKDYICPNGAKVPWCSCVNHQLVCIISPENQCLGYCREGETKEHRCPNNTTVPWCGCENNQFVCIISPENQCPKGETQPPTPVEGVTTPTLVKEFNCPSWCSLTQSRCICPIYNHTSEVTIATAENQTIKTNVTSTAGAVAIAIKSLGGQILSIQTGGTTAVTNSQIIVKNEKLFIQSPQGNVQIKILPNEASETAVKEALLTKIDSVELKGETLSYHVTGTKNVKILGIFPTALDIKVKINADSGYVTSVEKPWWSFLAW